MATANINSVASNSGQQVGNDENTQDLQAQDIEVRLKSLEEAIEIHSEAVFTKEIAQRKWLISIAPDLLKAIAWPSVFLLVFFIVKEPLNEVLSEFPSKFRDSTEFKAGSISFKTRVQTSARSLGGSDLANRVGELSANAIRTLLWGEGNLTTVTYSLDQDEAKPSIAALHIPGKVLAEGILELRDKGLIALVSDFSSENNSGPKTFEQYLQAIAGFPGNRWDIGEGIFGLKLEEPLTPKQAKEMGLYWTWEPTRDGEFAISLILEAVEKELSNPKASNKTPVN